jgi:hypothetical protein
LSGTYHPIKFSADDFIATKTIIRPGTFEVMSVEKIVREIGRIEET